MSKHDVVIRTWKQRWIPHPLLSIGLVYLWMALVDSFSLGSLVVGFVLGIAIPILTRNIWDVTPRIYSIGYMMSFATIVLWDIAVANLQVAYTIIARPNSVLNPKWIAVPLDLQSQEAIAILASTVSLTPGTVSCDLSANGRSLLVHALDTQDTDSLVKQIKVRYEARLLRIFR